MVSTSNPAAAQHTMAGASAPAARSIAHLNARVSAYLVDSVLLIAFILVFIVIGGSVLLLASDLGKGDPSDAAYYGSITVFLGGCIISWSAFNLALMRWRGQTAGMYVIGIGTVSVDGRGLTTRQTLLRWFGLHPLLFHPFLLPIWAILSLLLVSYTLNAAVLVVTLALALLCLLSPAASLLTLSLGADRRAPHDRLAGTFVVHLQQP